MDTNKYDFMRLSEKETMGVLLRQDDSLATQDHIQTWGLWDRTLILSQWASVRQKILKWLGREERNILEAITYLYN